MEKLTMTTLEFVQTTTIFIEEARTNFRNQESSIQNLETQVGKIATQLSTHLPNAFPSDTIVNPTVECYAITIGNGETFQDSKHEGLNKGNVKGTPTKPLKEEMEDEEWYMRIDVIEELNREVQQKEAMQKFQVTQGRYDVLDNTNQDFVMQEIDAIVQGNIAKMQQKNSAEMRQEHLEKQQPSVEEIQPNNVEVQQHVHDLLQQKNKGEVQQKTKYATLKGRPSRMLNHLPTILKYAFLGNTKNLTFQCKMLVDISHMLNTMKHEVRKLWDLGK
ncbi:hypothetical protein PIB30_095985 [Stylosanthes scabra]|uniref:Uncharacterized protein n=1 Tax=Stylosanthes scabra TaxID=79078 RepID=A0ABU6WU42_9FABA|nr:hypothetical protein [Stylosanthes scabra]